MVRDNFLKLGEMILQAILTVYMFMHGEILYGYLIGALLAANAIFTLFVKVVSSAARKRMADAQAAGDLLRRELR